MLEILKCCDHAVHLGPLNGPNLVTNHMIAQEAYRRDTDFGRRGPDMTLI